ncbi:MAG: thioredoxin family protein [Alphaproteobacteria bacterium]|nr:thioredoxin family protein [Alphaproteobacteria bacterium]
MALMHTPQKDETFNAAPFALKNIDGRTLSFDDIKGEKGTVLAFICNHCPYVQAIIERMVEDFKTLQDLGIGCAAIMPNDTNNYPEDSFENMKKFAEKHGFSFPYLIDDSQETARAYDAICTPDIFGFDAQDRLQYRGRLDSAGPNAADTSTTKELVNAMKEIAQSGYSSAPQFSSMGCSIKWK